MATPQELMQIGQQLIEACLNKTDKEFDVLSRLCLGRGDGHAGHGQQRICGLEAIEGKNDWWTSNNEVHELNIQGPYVHGDNKITLVFQMDVSDKNTGERVQMQEVGQYFVNQDGKIQREEFSYATRLGVVLFNFSNC